MPHSRLLLSYTAQKGQIEKFYKETGFSNLKYIAKLGKFIAP